MRLTSSFAVAILLASATSAFAQTVTDKTSGLSVTPPPGYVTESAPPSARYAFMVNVKRPDDRWNTGCRVGFQSAPQNSTLTQKEINAQTAQPEWANLLRATLEQFYEIKSFEPYEQNGVRGAKIIALIKGRDGLPAEALDIRNYLVMLETPKGRTNIICVDFKDNFAAREAEFDQVVRAVTLPR